MTMIMLHPDWRKTFPKAAAMIEMCQRALRVVRFTQLGGGSCFCITQELEMNTDASPSFVVRWGLCPPERRVPGQLNVWCTQLCGIVLAVFWG